MLKARANSNNFGAPKRDVLRLISLNLTLPSSRLTGLDLLKFTLPRDATATGNFFVGVCNSRKQGGVYMNAHEGGVGVLALGIKRRDF